MTYMRPRAQHSNNLSNYCLQTDRKRDTQHETLNYIYDYCQEQILVNSEFTWGSQNLKI